MILDPGFDLTLRPMKYPVFYECTKPRSKTPGPSKKSISRPTSSISAQRMTPAEQHLISRLVAFFATGDSIVGNNLVLNLYKHINSPEARMYLSRQLFEEALHVQFYLTLLDTYVPDPEERNRSLRRRRKHPFHPKESRVLLQVDRLHQTLDRNSHRR